MSTIVDLNMRGCAQGQGAHAAETVIGKVRHIIETLSAHPSLGLSELAQEAGLAKATVHRLCGDLVDWGIVKRIGGGRYALGNRLGELGGLVRSPGSFGDLAQCHAADLFARFRTAVGVSVLEEAQVRCIAQVSGTSYGHVGWMNTGGRMPIHCTASGKVIMAFSSGELFTQVTSQPLKALTPSTVISPRALALQLQGIRRNGYSLVRDEACTGSTSIGVPIVDRLRRPVAAFEMELPRKGASIPEVERLLKVHAARLGAELSSRMPQGRQIMARPPSMHATAPVG